jgi:parvulin-like peptidyl-prolyl isomerase
VSASFSVKTWLPALLLVSLVLSGCQSPQPPQAPGGTTSPAQSSAATPTIGTTPAPDNNEVVANIEGVVIKRPEYDRIFQQFSKMLNVQARPDALTNPEVQQTLKQLTLNKLIMDTLLKKDAAALGVTVSEEKFKQIKDQQIRQLGGPSLFNRYLSQNQATEDQFDGILREQLLMNAFLEKRGGKTLAITPQEMQTYYNKNKKEFDMPETLRASHILVKALEPEIKKELRQAQPSLNPQGLAQAVAKKKAEMKAKAEKIAQEVRQKPDDFAKLAREYSEDTVSGRNGGDLGMMTEKNLDPDFWTAAVATKPGSIHPGVVETQFGYHIIKVQDHGQPRRLKFSEAKPLIAARLEGEKKRQVFENWVSQRRQTMKVDIQPAYQPKLPAAAAQQTPPAAGVPAPAAAISSSAKGPVQASSAGQPSTATTPATAATGGH